MFTQYMNISLGWNANDIIPSYFPNITVDSSIDIALYVQEYTSKNGKWSVDWVPGSTRPFINEVSLSSSRVELVTLLKFETDFCTLPLHGRTSSIKANVCPVAIKVSLSKSKNRQPLDQIGVWSGVAFMEISPTQSPAVCTKWDELERKSGVGGDNLAEAVIPCPPTVFIARNDRNYQREEMNSLYRTTKYRQQFMDLFHPKISECYFQST